MNIVHLLSFREVMLSGSVSQAARNLGRTQPAISSAIAALEAEMGMQLFERRSRRLHPVPEAHYLLAEVTDILDKLDTARQNLRNLKALTRGELRLVSRLTSAHKDIRTTILTRSSPQVHQLISTQSYDLGIADLGARIGGTSQLVTPLPTSTCCLCAVPAADPLARLDIITPADLDGRPMAALHQSHSTHRDTRAAFAAAGATFDLRYETQYFIPLLNFVELGLACSVVDVLSAESYQSYRGADQQGIVFRPFHPDITVDFHILTPAHRPASHLASAFIALWQEEVSQINATLRDGAGAPRS